MIDKLLLSLRLKLSNNCTVKVLAAAAVGIPEIVPVDAVSVRPAGSEPAVIDHVKGAVPPDSVSVCE